ncbi:MAG TPA: hypothetical protein VGM56_00505 [Byssovorax sp.]|jgi:hypothetical protein
MDATSTVARAESRALSKTFIDHIDAASVAAAKLARRDAEAKRAMAAASVVALGATLGGLGVRVLDARVVFGDLLASAANKFVAFCVDGESIHIPRAKLAEVGRVLRRKSDLVVTVDTSALRIRWNAGRGGLNLVGRVVTNLDREVTLNVVFPHLSILAPEPPIVEAPPVAPRVKAADEQVACAPLVACELAAPAPCPRATTRWHAFQSYREIVELLRPALATTQPGAPLAVDADVFARVQALFGGAASRDQLGAIATNAERATC